MKYFLLLSLFATPVKDAFTQSLNPPASAIPHPATAGSHPATAGPYPVGYRPIFVTDSGRLYRPNSLRSDSLYYRPIEIDLWYPAAYVPPGSPIFYGEFISLLEQRSNRFQKDTVYNGLTSEMVQYLAANLQMGDTARLTRLPTNSFKNAQPANQRFPLILYMCSFNGMSYENINLFEWLAGHGYVVACITSVGRYPGNMSTQPADLLQQVDDGIFSMNFLKDRDFIDSTCIGAVGYSWGGLAALILAMRSPAIKALLSLDGSEMHYYGQSKEEDDDFNALRHARYFNPKQITAPYIYFESGQKQTDRNVDSIYNILIAIGDPAGYARFLSATHEDFSGLPSLGTTTVFDSLALYYFDKYLKRKDDFVTNRIGSLFRAHKNELTYPQPIRAHHHGLIIRGRVVDGGNNIPLAYANIGIPDKNIGTVSDNDGNFVLLADSSLLNDSLLISTVGFRAKSLPVRFFTGQKNATIQYATVSLDPKITELKEAVVTSKTPRKKIEGNHTTSTFISIGFPLRNLGSELGIRINLGRKPVKLKTFHFNIASSRIDSALFCLNIYSFKKGIPYLNILPRSILVPIGKRTGTYSVDLSRYDLTAQEDVLLSMELVEVISSEIDPPSSNYGRSGAVYFSAGFLNSAAWHRQTSQGRWKKAGGLGVGFNIETF